MESLSELKRRPLQALAKANGIKANQKSTTIIEQLLALQPEAKRQTTAEVDQADKKEDVVIFEPVEQHEEQDPSLEETATVPQEQEQITQPQDDSDDSNSDSDNDSDDSDNDASGHSDSDSSDSTVLCGNCESEVAEVQHCHNCSSDFCDECGFKGGCGVCDAEEHAWNTYRESISNIRNMVADTSEQSIRSNLTGLLNTMEQWKNDVEGSKDEIKCWSDNSFRDANEVMTDCGDSVLKEMKWYLNTANSIIHGTSAVKFSA